MLANSVFDQISAVISAYRWSGLALSAVTTGALVIVFLVIMVVDRRRRCLSQARQRELADLIAEFATRFIALSAEDVYVEMQRSAQRVMGVLGFDQISLFEFSSDGENGRVLVSRGTHGGSQRCAEPDQQHVGWAGCQMMQRVPIACANVQVLSAELVELKWIMQAWGVRSVLSVPVHGRSRAALAFCTVTRERTWDPELVQALQTVADIFGTALDRSRADREAAEHQQQMRGILDSAMDGVLVVDDNDLVVVFNAVAERTFGCAAAHALGQPIERFIPARFHPLRSADTARSAYSCTASRRMSARSALTGVRANGDEFPVDVSTSQVETGGGKLLTVIVRDLSERQRAEEIVRTSEQQTAGILDSLRNHVVVIDSKGIVIAENNPEIAFPKCDHPLRFALWADYFERRRLLEDGGPEVTVAFKAVQMVFEGVRDFAEMSFPVLAGGEERWLSLAVTPLRGAERGIVLSYYDITQRRRDEEAIRDVSARVIQAQEEERSRIARELHDDVNQQLAMICMDLQQVLPGVPEQMTHTRRKIEEIWRRTHELSMNVARISHQLHSAKVQHLGLVAALRDLCDEFQRQYKIVAEFKHSNVPVSLGTDVSLGLFRAAQETLRNVVKHSGAKAVRVRLIGSAQSVVLRVSDDGIGFDPSVPPRTGLGLVSLSERMRLVGGTFAVRPSVSGGTEIEAKIPLAGSVDGDRTRIIQVASSALILYTQPAPMS